MKNEVLKIEIPELLTIEESKANKIKATFEPMVNMLDSFEESYTELIKSANEEITQDVTARAKRLRLDIGRVRIETGKIKDKQKEYIKLEDKAIMGVHNILVWAVKEKEDKLKSIENHFETQERLRLEKLQSLRVELLSEYVEDAHERDLAKFKEDEFDALLAMKKKEKEDRIKAEKKAEELRIANEKAEIEERKRIEAENERLKKEAIERDRLAKVEAEKIAKSEKERIAKEEAAQKLREDKERKEREMYEAALKAEKERRDKIEAELKAKQDAELKAEKEAELKLQYELSKGDSEKINDLIADLDAIKSKYTFKADKNIKMYSDINVLIDKVISHAKNTASS